MCYPCFTKVIVNFFMTKNQSIPWRNKYDGILPIELTNEAIKNSKSYKEYYAIALGAEPPKTKASIRKKQSSSDTTMPPLTAKGKRLKTSAKVDKPTKEKQPAKTSKAKGLTVLLSGSGADKGTGILLEVPDVRTYESDDEKISWKSSKEDNDDEVNMSEHDEDVDDQNNDKDSHGMNVDGDKMDDKGANEDDDANELYRDVNINLEGQDIQMADVQTTQVIKDNHVTLTPVNPVENEDFLNKLDENIQKTIKEQVKEQVKAQVSKILPKLKKTVNEQLKAEVLTRSSNSSKTSHVVAANLSELELKKILIEKMESNKSIHRSDE
nr:hypothetical protein [Tanacetum cinerariifolium]